MNNIKVCFTPALFDIYKDTESIVVVNDILRSTTSICEAFKNGVKSVIPVKSLEEASRYKDKGYTVACERNGLKSDFADFGNSPDNFTKENIEGKELVYSTTNGTNTIMMAKDSHQVLIGSYLNINALCNYMINQKRDVVIVCSGWKKHFALEDTIFAGAVVEQLLDSGMFQTDCDSSKASQDLWSLAKPDLLKYIGKVAQRSRLKKTIGDKVVEYCHTLNLTDVVPCLKENKIIKVN